MKGHGSSAMIYASRNDVARGFDQKWELRDHCSVVQYLQLFQYSAILAKVSRTQAEFSPSDSRATQIISLIRRSDKLD
jgi:hypothetical protein